MSSKKRTVLIGLDGVPYELLRDLSFSGVMPNCKAVIESGFFSPIESTIPDISSVAWSSIITGANPAEHGIFGFMDIAPGTYRVSFPNFNSLRVAPFWMDTHKKSIILNVPSTFPVKPMRGVHISGFVSLDLERSVYPQTLLPILQQHDYRVDVESEKAHQSMNLFLTDLDQTLTARVSVAQFLWNTEDWDTFMLVFTGTDRLMHFLWDAYADTSHRYHHAFLDHFAKVDAAIGTLLSTVTEDDTVVMLSDHGMEHLECNVYINQILRDNGFLGIPCETGRYMDIQENTRVFSLDPARIYLNKKAKFPRGSVSERDEKAIIKDLIDVFSTIEINSKKLCKRVYVKEEIFQGPYLDAAPDMVLIGNQGLNLHSSLKASVLSDRNIFTGKHTHHNAFLAIKDAKNIYLPQNELNVKNVIHILEELNERGIVNGHTVS